jgi:site-specific DNA-methyltransferase (adenine-specific)
MPARLVGNNMDFPTRKYSVILADPPWNFHNAKGGHYGLASAQYSCMTIADIAALPVAQCAAENCALFMWISGPFLVEGKHLPIFEAWGFRPVTLAFVWNKLFGNGSPYLGLGYYTRSGSEPCLLGIRGSMPRKKDAIGVPQVITASRTRHSTKPHEVYDRIEALYDGPYLELFARSRREGWDVWGNEV